LHLGGHKYFGDSTPTDPLLIAPRLPAGNFRLRAGSQFPRSTRRRSWTGGNATTPVTLMATARLPRAA